jgi:prepilin-type N-terminal cleavage/methylation domain-containing protein
VGRQNYMKGTEDINVSHTCGFRIRARGFSLLEMIVAISVILIIIACTVPTLMTQVYAIRIRYSATDLSGLLQRARMEAVRKNTFYSLQPIAGTPMMEKVVDKNGVAVSSIQPAVMSSSVNISFGPGSGAPSETAFITSLNFAAAAATGLPSYNARGLPCVPAGLTCTPVPGQGFVFFVSGTGSAAGRRWAAVAVTPSGRTEVWTFDGTSWVQQ